jgi:taurine--2-oxoglutarate transaminase
MVNPVFNSWSAQGGPPPADVVGAEGSWFWTADGTRYLDMGSQLVFTNIGHGHPHVVAAVARQAAELCTIAPVHGNPTRTRAAEKIIGHAPAGMPSVFFTNAGTEANEHAVRMARLHTGRHKVLAAYRSYHGATGGSIALTGEPRRWGSEPGMPGVIHFFGPYTYRSSFHATSDVEEGERALAHMAEVLEMEGGHTVAAIILEPIVGTNGVLVPPDGYLAGVRSLCDRHGIVLIADEVMVGFGRAGTWFAIDRWGVVPDLITFAKGVNSGYVPLGGVIVSEAVAASFSDRPYPGGLTYSGHPLACAAAVANLEVLEGEALVERSEALGRTVFAPRLEQLLAAHPSVGEVRGAGCFWAVELVRDRGTREPYVPFNASGPGAAPMGELVAAFKTRGVWPFTHFNRIHLAPPFNIAESDLDRAFEVLDEVLAMADSAL